MPRKIYSSLNFRRNVPGDSAESVRRLSSFQGYLVTFEYRSFGPDRRRPRRNTDLQPLLLLATNRGEKVWKASNGRRYLWGFNLNYLSPRKRDVFLQKMIKKVDITPGVSFSFTEMLDILDILPEQAGAIFRKYDVRGSKLRRLKQVDLNTYRDYLNESRRRR